MHNLACVISQGKGKTLVLLSFSEPEELIQGSVFTKLFFHCVLIVRTSVSLHRCLEPRWFCIKILSLNAISNNFKHCDKMLEN